MMLESRTSAPTDREILNKLVMEAFRTGCEDAAMNASLQQWKYWSPHPLEEGSRSDLLLDSGVAVAHACRWPIRLLALNGCANACHLTDWVATPRQPGAGLQILRDASSKAAAMIVIGGTEITRKILPVVGFRDYNTMTIVRRPLGLLEPAASESSAGARRFARMGRNLYRSLFPLGGLPYGWRSMPVETSKIPETLWPRPSERWAVSERSPELLEHMCRCPQFEDAKVFLLSQDGKPRAYFLLVQVLRQVRLADYGPVGLDPVTSRILATAALVVARSHFKGANDLMAATSEESVRAGFERAGLRLAQQNPIRVLKGPDILPDVRQFRLTFLDWDRVLF